MKILLSNDDGVYAPGIRALEEELSAIAKIEVVAPDRDRSAASKSLTLSKPIRPRVLDNSFVSVDGTPADCVHYALTAYLKEQPDMVVAGINAGANLGDDVMYSGTVAAATEGRYLGLPSLATSLVSLENDREGDNYSAAAKVVKEVISYLLSNPLPSDTILNINIPDLPYEEIQGFEVTRLGQRHKSEPMIEYTDPRGHKVFWVGTSGKEQDAGPGTDFYAISQGMVSITPLEIDLTRYESIDPLKEWAENLSLQRKNVAKAI